MQNPSKNIEVTYVGATKLATTKVINNVTEDIEVPNYMFKQTNGMIIFIPVSEIADRLDVENCSVISLAQRGTTVEG